MAALIISISSDILVESVGSYFSRVILVGFISIKVLVALEVGAATVTSPTGVLEIDTHSLSEADPSESSPPPVSVAPMVLPFLCFDDSKSDIEIPERHVSHITSTSEIPIAPILPAPSAIIAPLSEEDIPIGRLYCTHPGGTCKALTARKSIRPLPSHRLALRYTSHHFDHLISGSSSSHLSLDHSSSRHSSSGHFLSRHTPPDTTIADSSTPQRFFHLPLARTLRCSEAYLSLRFGPLYTMYPLTASESSARDSSSESSAGPSCKRCRSPAATVTSSIHSMRALVPSRADILPPHKRFSNSFSPKDSVKEDIDMDVLEDIEADATIVEVAVDRDVEAGIDAGMWRSMLGLMWRTRLRMRSSPVIESRLRRVFRISMIMLEIPLQRIEDIETAQRQLKVGQLIERAGLSNRTRSLKWENLKVRALLSIERDQVDCLRRHMALSQEEFCQNMNITRFGMTPEAIEELVNRCVEEALAAYEATDATNTLEAENQSQNDSDGDIGNGGNGNGDNGNGKNRNGGNRNGRNENPNGRGDRPVARECTYQDFMKCQCDNPSIPGEIAIRELKKKLEIDQKEKVDIQLNVDKFEHASKSLNKLIDRQIVDNCKKGLGYENYNAVSPSKTRNFMPLTPDLSFTGLDKFVNKPVVENLHAKVDGKKIIVTELSVRRDLRLSVEEAYKKGQSPSGPTESVADRAVHKELGDRLVRAATTASSLEGDQDSGAKKPWGILLLKLGLRVYLNISMIHCSQETKTTQKNEIASLKRRVKKLEKKNWSRTHKIKRLYKVGLTARVESSGDEESLGEDASKQGRMIDAIGADEEITLVSVQDKVVSNDADKEMFDVDVLGGEEMDDIHAKIDADHRLAKRLQAQEQEELSDAKKATLFQQLLEKRKKHFAAERAKEKRKKPPIKAQPRKIMCTYLKNMQGYKIKYLKLKEFGSIQEMFDKAFKRSQLAVEESRVDEPELGNSRLAFNAIISRTKEEVIELDDSLRWAESWLAQFFHSLEVGNWWITVSFSGHFEIVQESRINMRSSSNCMLGIIKRASLDFFVQDKMSRDVITVGSTMWIPLLYKREYSQWREWFMNYLEEQTDGEAMTNSIQNGDQPLPVIAQVSLAGTCVPPTLKDPKFWTAEEKKTRKIDRLARSLLIQGLPNDIYSLIDSNETAKDLCDALERQMRGSEYGEQDRKAAILYEFKTFKATEGEQLIDTYLFYLQVINDLKKCGYKKDNYELNYKFLNHLQPEWKQYGTLMRQTKNLIDINIDALYNILKKNQGDVNDALRYKKKAVVVTSDPLALVAEKTKVSKRKEKVIVSSDSEGSVLLVEDQAWMESISDSDQEMNVHMVFMANMENIPSDSDESSSSAEETIAEEQNNKFDEQMKVLNKKNADLLAQTEVLHDQLKVKHVVIDT
nr:hypothetical protein [Tanacetum cinerariifolium]